MKKIAVSLFLATLLFTGVAFGVTFPPSPPYIIQSSDCTFLTWFGMLCQDTDDGKVYGWNGSATVELSLIVTGTPSDGYCVLYDLATTSLKYGACPGAGTGAPTDAEYVTYSSNVTLTADRVLTESTGIDLSTAVAGQIRINVNTTEIGTTTWGSGGESYLWTFNTTGTDPVVTVSDTAFDVTTGTLKQGGHPVALGIGSTTDNRLVRWDTSTHDGQLLQSSAITVDDSGNTSGMGTLGVGAITGGTYNKITVTAPATGATLTLAEGSSLITVGAYATTLTATNTTGVTLPTSGTLYGTAEGSITSAQLATSLTNETGTGVVAFATSPTFTTSILPSAAGATAIGTTLLPFSSIFIGDAATNNVQLINTAAASAVVLTLPSTTGTLALVDSQVFTTYIESPYIILGSAATAADAGAIRLPNAAYIMAEADAASTDISVIGVDSAEIVQIAASGATGVTITPDVTITGGDIILISDAAGAGITAGDGTLSLKGLGSGTDEILTIDLNTNNVITLDSTTSATLVLTPATKITGVLSAGSGPTTLTDATGKILSAALNTVAIAQGGTGQVAAATTSGVVYGASSTALGMTAAGAEGQILRAGASPFTPAWTTYTSPLTATTGTVFGANATNVFSAVSSTAAGPTVLTNTAGTITWESAAAPGAHAIVGASHTLAAATAGTLLTASAADAFGWTSATYPATATTGGIFYGSATNVVSQLTAGAATEILVGGGANLAPVWTTASGTGAPVRVGSPTFTGDVILPSTNADPAATAGAFRHDSTVSNFTNGALVYYNGAAIKQVVDMTTATASACTGGQFVSYDADADLWKCASAVGTGDFLADGTVPMTGAIDLVATGVKLSAANGVLTILGQGNGADENLTIDLNTDANVVTFNSGTSATFVLTPATKVTGVLSAGSGPTTLTDAAGKILSAALNTVGVTVGGTGLATATTGGIYYGSATNTIAQLAAGTAGQLLSSGGAATAPAWSTATYPLTATTGAIVYGASSTGFSQLVAVAAGQPLLSGGLITAPAYAGYTFSGTGAATYTFPGTSATLLGNGLTSAYVFVGNGSNVATGVAVTGDITITNAGVTAIGTDKIKDTMIDWGLGAGQVSIDDVDDGATYQRVIADDVNATGHVDRFYDSDGTGYITVTGLSTARAITLVDAAQTLVNLASNQTFSGNNTFTNVQYFGSAAAAGTLRLYDGSDNYTTLGFPAASGNMTFNFPTTNGTSGYVLITDGSGNTSWTGSIAGDVLDVGNCTGGACFDGTSDGGTQLLFYDAQGATTLVVGDNSGAVVLTLPTTTSTLAGLAVAQTFTANNVFGNADTDTLTIQSRILGSGRAITIDDDATSAPTYATGTNELFVEGDIETDGTVYAAGFVGGAGTDTQRRLTLTSNTSFDCATYPDSIYFVADAMYFCNSTASKTPMRLEDSQTATGLKIFSDGGIYVGDTDTTAVFRLYDGSTNYTAIVPGSSSADLTITLPTSAGATGQYLKTTTTGNSAVLSWDTPTASADTTGGTGGVQFNAAGVLTSDAGFVFTTATDKLTLGSSGGSTTGTIDLYYTGTTYAATITPNASMAADVTITLPASTSTLLGSGTNTFTGTQTITTSSAAASASGLSLGTTNTATTGNTAYSVYNTLTSSAVVSGTAQTLIGDYNLVTKSGANSTVDGETIYGSYNSVVKTGADTGANTVTTVGVQGIASNTGSTDVGIRNTHGGYFSATGDTAGTSVAYGVWATATGADSNWAGYFVGAVGMSSATPSLTLSDSDDAAGTGNLLFASANARDIVGTIQVDEGGTAVTYITIDGVNDKVIIGQATPDDNNVSFAIQGDADSDAGGDTTEALTFTLTGNATPTSSTWAIADTQGASISITSTAGTVIVDGVTMNDGAITLGTSKTITGTTGLTIGNNGQTIAIDSSDWDIDATGAMTGIGAITSNGTITTTGVYVAGSGPTTLTDSTGKILSAALNTVGIGQGGTGAVAVTTNGVIYGASSTAYGVTALGTEGQLLRAGTAGLPGWSTATYPATATTNGIMIATSATGFSQLATGNSGVLVTNGSGVPAIGTDIPTAVTIGGAYIYRASGTTIPVTVGGTGATAAATTNGIVYGASSTAYGMTAAATVEGSVLRAGASPFVPAWSAYAMPATVTTNALLYASSATAVASSTITTNGTDINAQALNLISTGAISGGVKVLTITTGLTIGTTPATVGTDRVVYGGAILVTTGTATIVLPALTAGMSVCVIQTTASATVINPDDSDVITLNGTALSAGDSITSASTSGDFICLLGVSTSSWISMGRSGTWTDTN